MIQVPAGHLPTVLLKIKEPTADRQTSRSSQSPLLNPTRVPGLQDFILWIHSARLVGASCSGRSGHRDQRAMSAAGEDRLCFQALLLPVALDSRVTLLSLVFDAVPSQSPAPIQTSRGLHDPQTSSPGAPTLITWLSRSSAGLTHLLTHRPGPGVVTACAHLDGRVQIS